MFFLNCFVYSALVLLSIYVCQGAKNVCSLHICEEHNCILENPMDGMRKVVWRQMIWNGTKLHEILMSISPINDIKWLKIEKITWNEKLMVISSINGIKWYVIKINGILTYQWHQWNKMTSNWNLMATSPINQVKLVVFYQHHF